MFKDLKETNLLQWYSQLKHMSSYDQGRSEQVIIESIGHMTDKDQAEVIADHISSVSQEYDLLQTGDTQVPHFLAESIPQFSVLQVRENVIKIRVKKATAPGDIPASLVKDS